VSLRFLKFEFAYYHFFT